MWSSIQVFTDQLSKNRSIRWKDIELRELQSYLRNRVKLWEQIEFKG